MRTLLLAAAASVLLAAPAFAQAQKIACTPNASTMCQANGKCETEPASATDKEEIMVLDFAAKKAETRKGGKMEPLGEIVDDRMDGAKRLFGIKLVGMPMVLQSELEGAKLTGKMSNEGATLTLVFDCAAAN